MNDNPVLDSDFTSEIYSALLRHALRKGLKSNHDYSAPADVLIDGAILDIEKLKASLAILARTTIEFLTPSGHWGISVLLSGVALEIAEVTGEWSVIWSYTESFTRQMLIVETSINSVPTSFRPQKP